MTDEQEWMDGFKGPEFDDISTEFYYHKLAAEIESINDPKVLHEMFKAHLRIYLKEKEMWKKLTNSMITPINIKE